MNEDLRLDEFPDDPSNAQDPTAALLRTVLHREADAVEPSPDGFARIQAEIERRRPSPAGRAVRGLTPLLAAAAALVVLAAGTTAVVRSVTHRSQVQPASGDVTLRADNDVRETPASALPVYVAARQNKRVVLLREFRRSTVQGVEAKVEQAVTIALNGSPLDDEATQLFDNDQSIRVRAHVTDTSIGLDLSHAPQPALPPTPQDAEAAVQQLVWTATAAAAVAAPAAKQPRVVTITVAGATPRLFGLARLDRTLTRVVDPDPRAPLWIDRPDGHVLGAGHLKVGGDGTNLGESAVRVVLRRDGDVPIRDSVVPLQRTDPQGKPLGPVAKGERGQWSIAGWPITRPGTYTLVVSAPADVPVPSVHHLTAFPDGTWWDSWTFQVK